MTAYSLLKMPWGKEQRVDKFSKSGDLCTLFIKADNADKSQRELNPTLDITLRYRGSNDFSLQKKAFIYSTLGGGFSDDNLYVLPSAVSSKGIPQQVIEDIKEQESKAPIIEQERRQIADILCDINFELYVKGNFMGNIVMPVMKSDSKDFYIEKWYNFFDYLLERNSGHSIIRYAEIKHILESFCGSDTTPMRSKIISIAEKMNKTMAFLGGKLKKNLMRTRKMMRVEQINELDSKCLESILRQKGNTIREKARNNKGYLLGVSRDENYNLLENRILKDFAYRCIQKSNEYLDIVDKIAGGRGFGVGVRHNEAVRSVIAFKENCKSIYNNAFLKDVPCQHSITRPNYVLQNDIYYKKVWKYYLELLNATKDIDDTVYCQHNTFQDIVELLLNIAIRDFVGNDVQGFSVSALCTSYVDISAEQINGKRIKRACSAGPFLVSNTNQEQSVDYVLEVITNGSDLSYEQNNLYEELEYAISLKAPTYLCFTKVVDLGLKQNYSSQDADEHSDEQRQDKEIYVIPVFSYHSIYSNNGNNRLVELASSLRSFCDSEGQKHGKDFSGSERRSV